VFTKLLEEYLEAADDFISTPELGLEAKI